MARSLGNSVRGLVRAKILGHARAFYEQRGRVPRHDLEKYLEAEVRWVNAANRAKSQRAEVRVFARHPAHQQSN